MGASGKDMAALEVESENARITAQPKDGIATMRIQKKYLTSLLVSDAAAPTASAAASPTPFGANPGTASTQYQPRYPYLDGLGIYHHGHGHRH
jgi:hypothetical protein